MSLLGMIILILFLAGPMWAMWTPIRNSDSVDDDTYSVNWWSRQTGIEKHKIISRLVKLERDGKLYKSYESKFYPRKNQNVETIIKELIR